GSDRSPDAILRRLAHGRLRPLTDRRAPAELVAICEKAMAREIARRYASMQDLAADLRAWLEGRVVRAHRTGAVAELTKWVGRNRLAAGGLAVSLAAIVLGLLNALAAARTERGLRQDAQAVNVQLQDSLVRIREQEADKTRQLAESYATQARLAAMRG